MMRRRRGNGGIPESFPCARASRVGRNIQKTHSESCGDKREVERVRGVVMELVGGRIFLMEVGGDNPDGGKWEGERSGLFHSL